MKRFFRIQDRFARISRVFEQWLMAGAMLIISVATTTFLSLSAFGQANATAESLAREISATNLAEPTKIDESARADYLKKIEERRVAAEKAARLEQEKLAQENAARAASLAQKNAQTATKTTKQATQSTAAKPTCDRLIIAKIGLNACLATVGLTANGAVDVHATLPAWFNQSSRAGTNNGKWTATFIDGHRSGIFRNLSRLAVGDQITVSFTNGDSFTYTVRFTETTSLNATDMTKALSIYGGAARGLNLMTCDGAYNSSLGTAERRLTVYTTL
jgi:sortase (surface protein transpeptidase)